MKNLNEESDSSDRSQTARVGFLDKSPPPQNREAKIIPLEFIFRSQLTGDSKNTDRIEEIEMEIRDLESSLRPSAPPKLQLQK